VDSLLAPIDLELETLAYQGPSLRAGWPVVNNRPGFDLCSTTNDEDASPATQRLHDRFGDRGPRRDGASTHGWPGRHRRRGSVSAPRLRGRAVRRPR
jgi:hypothetical protein